MTQAEDFVELTVTINDAGLRRRLALIASPDTMRRLNGDMGRVVLEKTKDHLDAMAATRHKVADRLGAEHSKFYEYASGRLAGSPRNQTTVLENVSEASATIAIKNTPGLSRAWHDLTIRPVEKRALTLPISRVSHGKRVADLRREGHEIFRPKGTNILAENSGKSKNARMRPLYALVGRVTVPKDEGLLPKQSKVREWCVESAEAFFSLMEG